MASAWPSRIAAALALALLGPGPAGAEVFLSRSEALAWAFPDADRVDARSFVLTDEQAARVVARSGAPLPSRIGTLHTGRRGEEVLGHAWIDVHTVRTFPEALLVVLSPEGRVARLRVLAFHEPSEYLPAERWLAQFEGAGAGSKLRIGREVHGIAGSTLSTQAVTAAVRRALALHEVLAGEGG